jgi:hypothetical protein
MNTTELHQHHDPGGNWFAFLFGAAFNLLSNVKLSFLLDYTFQAIVGGIVCLGFKILGDILSPLWERHKEKMRTFRKEKMKSFKIRKRKSDD